MRMRIAIGKRRRIERIDAELEGSHGRPVSFQRMRITRLTMSAIG